MADVWDEPEPGEPKAWALKPCPHPECRSSAVGVVKVRTGCYPVCTLCGLAGRVVGPDEIGVSMAVLPAGVTAEQHIESLMPRMMAEAARWWNAFPRVVGATDLL